VTAPLIIKQNDGLIGGIKGQLRASGQRRFVDRDAVVRARPAKDFPRCLLETGFSAVFGLHPILHDFELQWANRAQQRTALNRILKLKRLDDAFLQELAKSLAEAFELRGAWTLEPGEAFGREPRN